MPLFRGGGYRKQSSARKGEKGQEEAADINYGVKKRAFRMKIMELYYLRTTEPAQQKCFGNSVKSQVCYICGQMFRDQKLISGQM